MRYAFAYGADAVYAGQPRYSCVCATTNSTTKIFSSASMKPRAGEKVLCRGQHCTAQRQAKTFIRDLKPVVEMGPDALIIPIQG